MRRSPSLGRAADLSLKFVIEKINYEAGASLEWTKRKGRSGVAGANSELKRWLVDQAQKGSTYLALE